MILGLRFVPLGVRLWRIVQTMVRNQRCTSQVGTIMTKKQTRKIKSLPRYTHWTQTKPWLTSRICRWQKKGGYVSLSGWPFKTLRHYSPRPIHTSLHSTSSFLSFSSPCPPSRPFPSSIPSPPTRLLSRPFRMVESPSVWEYDSGYYSLRVVRFCLVCLWTLERSGSSTWAFVQLDGHWISLSVQEGLVGVYGSLVVWRKRNCSDSSGNSLSRVLVSPVIQYFGPDRVF